MRYLITYIAVLLLLLVVSVFGMVFILKLFGVGSPMIVSVIVHLVLIAIGLTYGKGKGLY